MITRTVLATSALAAALLVPAGAHAATVTLDKTCYVEGQVANYSASGFPTPGTITFSDPATLTDTAPGAFVGQFNAPIQPDNRTNAITTQTFTVTSPSDGTATANYSLVNFAADAGTSFKSAKAKRKWSFSGFPVGLPVYGHFRRGGRKVVDYKFGVAPAPCGQFTKRAPGVPKKKAKFGKYTVQFDNAKKYSSATRPAYRYGFKVIKIFK
jgi:hypothetical protein